MVHDPIMDRDERSRVQKDEQSKIYMYLQNLAYREFLYRSEF